MWMTLSEPWRACLEEAWAAYCAGSAPIGAVVVDAAGRIAARGRNHIDDDDDAPVRRHELAHAELNALLTFRYADHPDLRGYALYTLVEPCPLCLGAFYMSGLRELRYASREPWAGSVDLLGRTPYLSRKPIRAHGPDRADLEALAVALNVESALRGDGGRAEALLKVWAAASPDGVRLGRALFARETLIRLKAEAADAPALVAAVWPPA